MPDAPTATEHTVYEALNEAVADLASLGVARDGHNTNQNFSFRSIDGVTSAVRDVLLPAGITFIPSFTSLEQIDYKKDDGRVQHRSILLGKFVVRGPGGDSFEFTTIGEGMDTEGRASNKAMSAATKNAYLRLLQIGSGGEDGDTHDVQPQAQRAPAPRPAAAPQPSLAGRVAQAAGAPAAAAPADTGEKLSEGQGRNLYRLWKHVLHWDRDEYAQQIEISTGVSTTDDRNLTKQQASQLIYDLKVLGNEPVEGPRPGSPRTASAPATDYDPGPTEPAPYDEEPF